MEQKQVRCNECKNRVNLFGNKINILCKVSNKIEPLNEPLTCEDFEPLKQESKK